MRNFFQSKYFIRLFLLYRERFALFMAIIVVCFVFAGKAGAQQASYIFTKYDTDNGLTQSVVNCILQDSTGFIWIGTQDGLNRFDGNQFLHYPMPAKLGNNREFIASMVELPGGLLFIATRNTGIFVYNKFKDKVEPILLNSADSGLISKADIKTIANYNNDALLIGTNIGLFYYSLKTKRLKEIFLPVLNNVPGGKNIQEIYVHSNKNVFLGTENGLIELDHQLIFRNNYPQRNHTTPAQLFITSIVEQSTGDLLLGTARGIKHFSIDKKMIRTFLPEEEFLAEAEISGLRLDRKGNLWASTFGSGLFYWQQATDSLMVFQQGSQKNSFPNNYMYGIYIDNSGLVWVGTYGQGVVSIHQRNKIFKQFPDETSAKWIFSSSDVYAITSGLNNDVFMGTDNGLITYHTHSEQATLIKPNNNQFIDVVYALYTDSKGIIWIGTAGKGLYYATYNSQAKEYNEPGLLNGANNEIMEMLLSDVLSITEDSKQNLWVATRMGLVKINAKRNSFSAYSLNNKKLTTDEVSFIGADNSGEIWLASMNQLYKLNEQSDKFEPILSKEFLAKINQINNFSFDRNDEIWLGTDDGLRRYNHTSGQMLHLTTKDGLPDNVIYSIHTDDKNNLWITTGKGLAKVKVTKNSGVNIVNYTENDGITCIQFHLNAIHKSRNGRMYLGCEKGILTFNPHDVIGNEFVPPIVITDFKLFFESVPISENGETPLSKSIATTTEILLEHTQHRVSFSFAALNFIDPNKNQYAYFMENMDKEWVMAGNERTANYILLPGEYTFMVRASNNDGIWNDTGVSIRIVVSPPIYQRTWFVVVVILLVMGLTFLFIHMRTRNLRYRQRELETKVTERTFEVLQQKKELELQADKLNQINEELNTSNEELNATLENLRAMQSQLVSHEKMASLGQLTAGVAHEINNPINFINGNISPLKRDIDDVLRVMNLYQQIIDQNKLQQYFSDVEKLKQNIDLDYTINEMEALISGIKEGAQRTTDIVKGLRNFSRLDEDDMKLANVNEGIQSTVLILRNKIKNRADVQLVLGDIPEIICYPGKLNQVFMNIISNAVDAMNENGGQIVITTTGNQSHVFISIRDNGKGIPQEIIERIFEPFFTTKDVGKGTGLGLSISYGIIQKHKGDIKVTSEIGEGSEFLITLPIQQPNEPEKGAENATKE